MMKQHKSKLFAMTALALVILALAGQFFTREVRAETTSYGEVSFANGNLLEVFDENKLRFYMTKKAKGSENGEVYLAGCATSVKKIYVNETIKHNGKEYDIIGINDSAFYGNDTITSVVIYSGLKYIGESAFWRCSKLKTVTLPDTLTDLGEGAFDMCSALTSITIPDKVKVIQAITFRECTSLKKVKLGKALTKIEDGAFYMCYALQSITIPNKVTSIGDYAFESCRALKTVKLGKSVKQLGVSAFSDNKALIEVKIPDKISIIPQGCFSYCEVLKNVILGKNVKQLGSSAFAFCSELESVTTSGKLETIDEGAFQTCRKLRNIKFDDTLKSINNYAFYECSALSDIEINNNLEYIGVSAFADTAPVSLTLRGNGLKIDKEAFYAIFSLKSVRFEEGVEYIGDSVFNYCMELIDIEFSSTINYIGQGAFETTKWLRRETGFDPETFAVNYSVFIDHIMINDILLYINPYEIASGQPGNDEDMPAGGHPYSTKLKEVYEIPEGTRVIVQIGIGTGQKVNIPEGVEIIESMTYRGVPEGTIKLPSTLKEVGEGCFASSTFSSITLPSGVTKLSNHMFRGCSNLKAVNIKGDITSIGDGCFAETALTNFTIPSTVKYLGEYAFDQTDIKSIKLPAELVLEGIPSTSNGFTIYVKKKSKSADAVLKLKELNRYGVFANFKVKYY